MKIVSLKMGIKDAGEKIHELGNKLK